MREQWGGRLMLVGKQLPARVFDLSFVDHFRLGA
jgi:hypothetical protein